MTTDNSNNKNILRGWKLQGSENLSALMTLSPPSDHRQKTFQTDVMRISNSHNGSDFIRHERIKELFDFFERNIS